MAFLSLVQVVTRMKREACPVSRSKDSIDFKYLWEKIKTYITKNVAKISSVVDHIKNYIDCNKIDSHFLMDLKITLFDSIEESQIKNSMSLISGKEAKIIF
jgi:hypothetical protein